MNETNCSKFKKRAAALAVASCLTLAPWLANAAGLGKITVLSGLGQPLRAELEVSANRDELAGMTARLAPQEVFRQAGVDYATVLLDLRFAVEKRAGGQTVVKITSGKPVNEPFLDFLVELNWPAGRLVREYTFLLDPPEVAVKQATRAVVDARIVETVPGGGAQPAPVMRSAPAPRSEPAVRPAAGETRVVRAGDNLRKIAAETQHDGVSLEQMLVGIFRKNPDAFVGNNMNRLKAGAILGLPDQETVASIPEGEAKRVFLAQASDWNSYRQKLAAATAAAPVPDGAGSQTSSGQITARVEEKLAPAEQAKDQVKVARTDVAAPGGAGGRGSAEAEADRIARDKALKEAQDRLAMLEKNVAELQKLVELKNLQLAELQQQAASKSAAKPVEPAKVEEAAKPVEPPPPVVAAVAPEAPKAEEAPVAKPAEAAPAVEPPKAPEPPQPVASTPPPPAPPPELEPESGLLDAIFGDPLPLAGGVGILALLAGYFIYRRRRSDVGSLETTTAPGPSSLGPNSVFRMTGGQSVDTGNTPPQTGDFSQTGPGTIDTDEVDPVAEADVYMAYGRDTQAEEILLEALQKDPQRTAIHAKLLEIYANRRSLKQFETLASELYSQTGGVGSDWEKVAALGVGLDPQNPLYSGVAVKAPAFDSDATMVVSPSDVGKATLAMASGALAQIAAAEPAEEQNQAEDSALVDEFENDTLVLGEPEAPAAPDDVAQADVAEAELGSLDFDLGVSAPEAAEADLPPVTDSAFPTNDEDTLAMASDALDFDISGDVPPSAAATTVGDLRLHEESAQDVELGTDVTVPDTTPLADDEGGGHDFSPEGTLLMPVPGDDDIDLHMEAAASTFVGEERQTEPPLEVPAPIEPMVDFALDIDQEATATVVNPLASDESVDTDTLVNAPPAEFVQEVAAEPLSFDNQPAGDQELVPAPFATATETDLEFDVNLTDSVFLGQPMNPSDFDIGSINLDLGAEPASEKVAEEATLPEFDQPAEHDAQWEEVNTKLDLAKAYEEMGDLEGARELLQEVLGEGSADLVDQAQAILARIGE